MPFTDIASYPRVGREFQTHWGLVNIRLAELTSTDLVLTDEFTIEQMDLLNKALDICLDAVKTKSDALELAGNDIVLMKPVLTERFKQLRMAFGAYLGATKYGGTLPLVPKILATGSDWERALNSAAKLWLDVNADTTLTSVKRPVLLAGDYDQVQFAKDASDFVKALRLWEGLPTELNPLINQRNSLMGEVKTRAIQYRGVAQSRLAATEPLYKSLPVAVQTAGRAEGAVRLRLSYVAGSDTATLKWKAPPASIVHLQAKICSGARWKESASRVVAELEPYLTEFTTPPDLLTPGTSLLRIISVSETGREANSNSVKVIRQA